MTNHEALKGILRSVADGLEDLLTSTLRFETFEAVNRKNWGEATSALRSVHEAVALLTTIAYIDKDIETLPELDRRSMAVYSSTFGNRCYWMNVAIQKWLESVDDDGVLVKDHRFDLDFDEVVEETTETKTTTKKTRKRKKRGE